VSTQTNLDLGNALAAEQFLGINYPLLHPLVSLRIKDGISCPVNTTRRNEAIYISLKLS
ncbi:hypothetical protein A2U01_0117339, partial [Trifolium medium]|nr:hypothetical protein [Trifolium medium]